MHTFSRVRNSETHRFLSQYMLFLDCVPSFRNNLILSLVPFENFCVLRYRPEISAHKKKNQLIYLIVRIISFHKRNDEALELYVRPFSGV